MEPTIAACLSGPLPQLSPGTPVTFTTYMINWDDTEYAEISKVSYQPQRLMVTLT